MSLHIAFQRPAFSTSAPLIGLARASETVAAAATGSLTAETNEIAIVTNVGESVLYFAFGSTPSSAAVTATDTTSARQAIPVGGVLAVDLKAGDKFAVASS